MKKFKTLMSLTFVVLLAISAKAQYTDVDLQNAINAAAPGSTITLNTGTYVFGAVVNVNKAVTLKGNSTLFQVSGTGVRLDISADGAGIEDVLIEKTDKTGTQNIIEIHANNVTIKNNTIWGQFVIGDPEVSRAMVFWAGAYSGIQIEGNTIFNLRQPAYISGTHTGNIINNYVYNTKGWVVEGGNLTFSNNTWGINVYDIAILSLCPGAYYTDIVAMSNANNGAVIEDQRVSPAVLSVVYVDASTAYTTDLGGKYHPFSTIQPAITRVVSGGKILVAAGTYVEPVQVDINKNVTILGAGAATTIVKPGFSTTLGGNVKSEAFIYIDPAATVVIKNFTFDCLGQQVNHAIQSRGALDIQDCVVKNVKHGTYMGRGIVYFGGTTNNLVKNVSMTNIERIGVHIRGNVMSPNPIVNVENFTYTGKGVGDWLDYGIEFGGGGGGAVKNANITNCKGVASVDGSTSAGILVTDYWGTGTNATVTNSSLTNNTTGMAVGYGPTDNSIVVAYSNNISNNTSFGISSTNPLVNAKNNWWGHASGPFDNKTLPGIPNYNNPTGLGNAVTSKVDYQPWNLFANYYNDPLNPYKLYITSGPTVFDSLVYPNDSWPLPAGVPFGGYVGEPNDWGFLAGTDYYIVPEVGSYFGASTIVVEWDNTQYGYAGYTAGNIYGSGYFNTLLTTSGTITRLTIDGGLLNNANQTTPSGGYIAKISLTLLKTGYAPVNFYSYNFRYYDGLGGQGGVYFTDKNAKVKNYLGDVVSTTPASQATGDGKVNVDDLNFWSQSYWSGVTGFTPLYTNYKAKYDIGPTSTNTVYGMPITDKKIQFEDLVIFAMSYGLSGNGVYPKVAPVPTEPVEVTVGKPIASGNETLVPLFISGAVQDLRAASLSFSGSFGKLISAEKGDLLNSYTTPVMVMSRADGNNVFVDLSIMGADVNGLSEEGQLFVLRFEGKANVNVTTAELRNLANSPMLVKLNGNYKGIPTEFGLSQNYPNPFNPSTMISYQVPFAAMVQIAVFNSIGEKVGTLVNEVKEPGYYEVTWNASAMPSGVYFFRINAGEFIAVKKMMLTK